MCSVFGLKPEKLKAVFLQGGTLGSCVQRVWSQSDTMTGEGWGACLKARQNWDVETGKRVGENGSTSALMRAGGMTVFPVGTESRTMMIREMSEWDHLDI